MKGLRQRMPWIAFPLLGLTLMLASWSYYRNAKRAADEAARLSGECERLIDELQSFRGAPRIASLEVEPPDRIAARVTTAAAVAHLSPASILSVDPQPLVRLGRSAYQLRATQIVLQNASLEQIAGFANGLEEPSAGMIVRDMSLNRSKSLGENASELWRARLTLTQMVFSPISGR